jgi:tetratricopeptide (TPR) repeat protein
MNPQLQGMVQQAIQAFQGGNFDGADLILHEVLQNDINSADSIFELGITYAKTNKLIEASAVFNCLLPYKKDDVWILYNLGLIHSLQSNHRLALEAYDLALQIEPNNAEVLVNKGLTCIDIKNYELALEVLEKAIQLRPDIPEAWSNKGVAQSNLNLNHEALKAYEEAIRLNPNYHVAWSNKSIPLNKLKLHTEALFACDKAIALNPDYAQAFYNKAIALHELKRIDEAIANYDKALSLKPDYHEASLNKSHSLLLQGDFENGLSLYESRWTSEKMSEIAGRRLFDKTTWHGVESLQGKTILVYGEQGFGDVIQFCRYIEKIANLGAKVILEVPQSLAGLLEGLKGVSQLIIEGQKLPAFDYQCPLLSLPLVFNTNISSIPGNIPYLKANTDKVLKVSLKLGAKKRKRIGLVWSSVSAFRDDSKRSLKLEKFVKALPLEGFEYVCLQKELKECDKELFKTYRNIKFYGDEINDFQDTAALIENLDLVISTCTSVAHLAGALGKETWLLLSFVPDWRWLLDRDDSPWYPSMKLYRQTSIGDWNSVLDRVKLDLDNSLS